MNDDDRGYTNHFEPEITGMDIAIMLAWMLTIITGFVGGIVYVLLEMTK